MPRRRSESHDMPPAHGEAAPPGTGRGTAAGRRRRTRGIAAAACSCAAGGSAGYALGGPVLAAAGLAAVAAVSIAAAVVLSAMLGRRDARSPFERLMLVICVVTGRRPGDYLPPPSGAVPPVPAVTVVRVAGGQSPAPAELAE